MEITVRDSGPIKLDDALADRAYTTVYTVSTAMLYEERVRKNG